MNVHFIGAGPGDPEPITVGPAPDPANVPWCCTPKPIHGFLRVGAGDQAANSQPGVSLGFR